ncbi:MAG: Two component transcriptional regulator, winged helix family [candidate division WS6 bacterium GW2011_GWF2_39_15]|uniref:Two component transcriptional regulator, winged helix family n=1 Tax=candidate division WS6 bacterium GW2011_GWF2_39_15 TaxID=1619100 RepID=A0A0G0MTJ9_9BACT|nr:MAG: Two component transcriptional regulator, winged helix family [candidate division WS6 bacterium GW2011_GWF2_39_15]
MNILIIEDYPSVAQITKNILESNGWFTEINSSKKAKEIKYEECVFDLIIMDVNLKETSSSLLVKEIRNKAGRILILGIASKATWKEKVLFLNEGADDVLDYPYAIQELLARINSLLRRPKTREEKYLRFKDINIDTDLKYVTKDNEEIPLRRREYTLLEYLVKNKNRTLTRNELLEKVWDYRKLTTSNTVDVHVKKLRDKLQEKDLIKTVHGFGYVVKDTD